MQATSDQLILSATDLAKHLGCSHLTGLDPPTWADPALEMLQERDLARGLSFLYNRNRLNVATSRALCTSFLLASPRLFEPDCRTPEQMRWANGLCRFRELAEVLEMDRAGTGAGEGGAP